jgi:hypothetical protein
MATQELKASDLQAMGVEPPMLSMTPTALPTATPTDPSICPETGAPKAWSFPQPKPKVVWPKQARNIVPVKSVFFIGFRANSPSADNDDEEEPQQQFPSTCPFPAPNGYAFGPHFGPRFIDDNTGEPAFLPPIVELSVAGPIGSKPRKLHVVDPRCSASGSISRWHAEQEAAHAEKLQQEADELVTTTEAEQVVQVRWVVFDCYKHACTLVVMSGTNVVHGHAVP